MHLRWQSVVFHLCLPSTCCCVMCCSWLELLCLRTSFLEIWIAPRYFNTTESNLFFLDLAGRKSIYLDVSLLAARAVGWWSDGNTPMQLKPGIVPPVCIFCALNAKSCTGVWPVVGLGGVNICPPHCPWCQKCKHLLTALIFYLIFCCYLIDELFLNSVVH